jgi:hypothetical protein
MSEEERMLKLRVCLRGGNKFLDCKRAVGRERRVDKVRGRAMDRTQLLQRALSHPNFKFG